MKNKMKNNNKHRTFQTPEAFNKWRKNRKRNTIARISRKRNRR